MQDREIIRLYWNRDERAIAETDAAYGAYCRTIAETILGSPLDTDDKRRSATVMIRYSLPLLSETSGSMGLTEDGDLIVHFCERELTYHVGKARADAFIEYLNRNCNPKKLAEQTTAGYTVPPSEE